MSVTELQGIQIILFYCVAITKKLYSAGCILIDSANYTKYCNRGTSIIPILDYLARQTFLQPGQSSTSNQQTCPLNAHAQLKYVTMEVGMLNTELGVVYPRLLEVAYNILIQSS